MRLVDVVVPCHGIGPVLADTLLSVFRQASRVVRLRCTIVVDGCIYPATTSAILQDLAACGDFPVELVFQPNRGVVAARNAAIALIRKRSPRSNFVLFLDGDDILPPNYLNETVDALVRAGEAQEGGARAGWVYVDQYHFGDQRRWVQYPVKLWGGRFAVNNLSQPSSIIDRALLDEGLTFDTGFEHGIEDWEFWCQAVGRGYTGVHSSRTYVRYRRLSGSRSSFNRANDALTKFQLLRKHSFSSVETIAEGGEVYPQIGAVMRSPADEQGADRLGIAAHVRWSGRSDEELASRLHGALSPRRRYGRDGQLDDPYVPDLLILEARLGETLHGLRSSLHAAEAVLDLESSVPFARLRDPSGNLLLLCRPSRLWPPRADMRAWSGIGIEIGWSGAAVTPAAEWSTFSDQVSASAEALIDALWRGRPPVSAGKRPRHLPRDIVGKPYSMLRGLYRSMLGFVPMLGPPGAGEERTAPVDAFVLQVGASRVFAEDCALRARASAARGRRPVLLLVEAKAEGGAADAGELPDAPWSEVLTLPDLFPRRGRTRRYNGVDLHEDDLDWQRHASGLLFCADTIVNFGVLRLTPALALLRRVRQARATYVPDPSAAAVMQIEMLIAHSGVYDAVEAGEPSWRALAQGLGVKHTVL